MIGTARILPQAPMVAVRRFGLIDPAWPSHRQGRLVRPGAAPKTRVELRFRRAAAAPPPEAAPINLTVTKLSLSPRFAIIWQEWRQAMKRLERLEREVSRAVHELRPEMLPASEDVAPAQLISERLDSWPLRILSTAATQRRLRILSGTIGAWPALGAFQNRPGTTRPVSRLAARVYALLNASHRLPVVLPATHPENLPIEWVFRAKTPTAPRAPDTETLVPRALVRQAPQINGDMRGSRTSQRSIDYATAPAQPISARLDSWPLRILSTSATQRQLRILSGAMEERPTAGAFQSMPGTMRPVFRLAARVYALLNASHRLPVVLPATHPENLPIEWVFRAKTPTAPRTPAAELPVPRALVRQAPQINGDMRGSRTSRRSIDYATAPAQPISARLDLWHLRILSTSATQRQLRILSGAMKERPAAGAFQSMPGTIRPLFRPAARTRTLSNASQRRQIVLPATYPESPPVEGVSRAKTPTAPRSPDTETLVSRALVRQAPQINGNMRESRTSRRSIDYATAPAQPISERLDLWPLRILSTAATQRQLRILSGAMEERPAVGAFQDIPGTMRPVFRLAARIHPLSNASQRRQIVLPATYPENPPVEGVFRAKTPTAPRPPDTETLVPRTLVPQAPQINGNMQESRISRRSIEYATARAQTISERQDWWAPRVLRTTVTQRRLRFLSGETWERPASGGAQKMVGIAQPYSRSPAEPDQLVTTGTARPVSPTTALRHAPSKLLHRRPVASSPTRHKNPQVERVFRAKAPTATVTPPAETPAAMRVPAPKTPQIDITKLDTVLWQRFEKRLRIERERRGRL